MKQSRRLIFFLSVLFFSAQIKAQNCDPWIQQAYQQLYHRSATAEECNIRNYNNGSWNNYDELVTYIKNYNNKKSASASTASCDPWIVQAYQQLYGRKPTSEECNIKNYNNGSWNNYNELITYVKNYTSAKTASSSNASCDPWIVQAYQQLYGRKPSAQECNIRNYNNGSWNNYDELVAYIKNYNKPKSGSNVIAPGSGSIANPGNGNIINAGGGNVIAPGGGNVIASGGGNVIAPGGGNVIAPGGGNVIAPGGGNVIAPGGGNVISPGGANMAAPRSFRKATPKTDPKKS